MNKAGIGFGYVAYRYESSILHGESVINFVTSEGESLRPIIELHDTEDTSAGVLGHAFFSFSLLGLVLGKLIEAESV